MDRSELDRLLKLPEEWRQGEFENGFNAAVWFREIAGELMRNWRIIVTTAEKRSVYALGEVEFYLQHADHFMDPFAHASSLQRTTSGNWYFHRAGTAKNGKEGAYKGGSYKGLDLTFGDPGRGLVGGMLIRTIVDTESNTVIEGPCRTVDTLLKASGASSIVDFVGMDSFRLDALSSLSESEYEAPLLSLCRPEEQKHTTNDKTLLASPRVGLTLKKDTPQRRLFQMRPLRFLLSNLLQEGHIRKYKHLAALSLYVSLNEDAESVREKAKLGKVQLRNYVAHFSKGLSVNVCKQSDESEEPPAKRRRVQLPTAKTDVASLCTLFGALYDPASYATVLFQPETSTPTTRTNTPGSE
ncbi:MAG: hypothetical protein MHM6MM_004484 [Cercozoa sp. M6MM]